jgi:hypothetical protein
MLDRKHNHLTKERIEAMEAIGFVWKVRDRPEWSSRFEDLLAYKEKYGNTVSCTSDAANSTEDLPDSCPHQQHIPLLSMQIVPQQWPENRSLGKVGNVVLRE